MIFINNYKLKLNKMSNQDEIIAKRLMMFNKHEQKKSEQLKPVMIELNSIDKENNHLDEGFDEKPNNQKIFKSYSLIVEGNQQPKKEETSSTFKEFVKSVPRHYYDPFYNDSIECRVCFYCFALYTIILVILLFYLSI
jgi:hypothetical protein